MCANDFLDLYDLSILVEEMSPTPQAWPKVRESVLVDRCESVPIEAAQGSKR